MRESAILRAHVNPELATRMTLDDASVRVRRSVTTARPRSACYSMSYGPRYSEVAQQRRVGSSDVAVFDFMLIGHFPLIAPY